MKLVSRPTGIEKIDLFFRDTVENIKRLIEVAKNGVKVSVRQRLNFIAGDNVTLDVVDNTDTKSVDITIGAPAGSGFLVDGDKGDITVSGAGTNWQIDPSAVSTTELATDAVSTIKVQNDAITYAKIQNVTDARLLGRSAGSAGDAQELTVSSPITLVAGVLDFDETVAIGNSAKVAVGANGSGDTSVRRRINFVNGTGITITVVDDAGNNEADVTVNAGSSTTVLATHTQDLGSIPVYSGNFVISGLVGLTKDNPVFMQHLPSPSLASKGTREDEAEMDILLVSAFCLSTTSIQVYWNCSPKSGPVTGEFKFTYLASA